MSQTRVTSYGQLQAPTWVDRFGVWLSARQFRRFLPPLEGKRAGDLGCGFDAKLGRALAPEAESLFLVDLRLNPDLRLVPNARTLEGLLPHCLSDVQSEQFDVLFLNSVLEHLRDDELMLKEMHRLLVPGGIALINVPSWRGRHWLEFSAFKLGLSPKAEMEDHKRYYDVRDLWPLLVAAGFSPSSIKCFSHKFGLNTFAACVKR